MNEINDEKLKWRRRSHEIAKVTQLDLTYRARRDATTEFDRFGSLNEAVRYLHENSEGEILVDFDFLIGDKPESDHFHFMNDLDPHLSDEEKEEYIEKQIKVKVADAVYHQKYPI